MRASKAGSSGGEPHCRCLRLPKLHSIRGANSLLHSHLHTDASIAMSIPHTYLLGCFKISRDHIRTIHVTIHSTLDCFFTDILNMNIRSLDDLTEALLGFLYFYFFSRELSLNFVNLQEDPTQLKPIAKKPNPIRQNCSGNLLALPRSPPRSSFQ